MPDTAHSNNDFAEQLGTMLANFLLWPPMAGRVSAALMMSPIPLTHADLQEQLGASVGSISETTRLLQTTGVIHRIKTPGIRRAEYEWSPDAWVNCVNHFTEQMSQLQQLADTTSEQADTNSPHFIERLNEMSRYYQLMTTGIATLAQRYEDLFNNTAPRDA